MSHDADRLPDALLTARSDQEFEFEINHDRMARARQWAIHEFANLIVMESISDDDIQAQVNDLWRGVSDRLTRFELLNLFFKGIEREAEAHANLGMRLFRRQMSELENSSS